MGDGVMGDGGMDEEEKRALRRSLWRVLDRPFDQDFADALSVVLPHDRLPGFVSFLIRFLLPRDHGAVFWGDRLLTLDKSAGFLDEPAIAAGLEDIRGSHDYDAYAAPHGIAWRINTLCWAGSRALTLPAGDFVECGVFKGDMAWCVNRACDLPGHGRQFYLYDSFEGFDPKLSGASEIPDTPGYFDFANTHYQREGLGEQVVRRFRDFPHIHVVQGFLPDAFDVVPPPAAIAYLHVDLNSPTAEGACYERLFDRVVPGGAIVLDDYGWKIFRKQKDVADAFFAARNLQVLELPTGQGLVIK
jgi:O-methyltransferase